MVVSRWYFLLLTNLNRGTPIYGNPNFWEFETKTTPSRHQQVTGLQEAKRWNKKQRGFQGRAPHFPHLFNSINDRYYLYTTLPKYVGFKPISKKRDNWSSRLLISPLYSKFTPYTNICYSCCQA